MIRKIQARFLTSLPKLKLKEETLEILLPEKTEFHYQWLRDNCQSPRCIHPSTRQKLHSSGQILSVKPTGVKYINDHQIQINWPKEKSKDGEEYEHVSTFDIEFLKRFNYNIPFRPLINPILWNAEQYTRSRETVDYQDFLTPKGFKNTLQYLRDYGLCFLKNVPTENEFQVETIAKKFGVIKVLLFY
jgi:gamma-butyrobetaine dioxygenase